MNKNFRKLITSGIICLSVMSVSGATIFANNLDMYNEVPGFELNNGHVTVSKEKMDSYRNSYIETFGTDDGFDESEIQSHAQELMDMSLASNTSTYGRQMIKKYFEKIQWITRNGVVSLSIYPTKEFSSGTYGHSYLFAMAEESWGIIVRNYSNNSKWKNTLSLKQQYKCHVIYARNAKVPWNIEPHRTETNFANVIKKGCNP